MTDQLTIEDYPEVDDQQPEVKPRRRLGRTVAFALLPAVVLVLALVVGYLKWQADSVVSEQRAGAQSAAAATAGVTAMLSYRADHVEQDLVAASGQMTGDFHNEFTTLINDLVIPGAREQRISAEATVPAVAVLSADADRAQLLVYINQTTTIGDQPPTDTQSSARVDMQKVDDRWLMSGFEPV